MHGRLQAGAVSGVAMSQCHGVHGTILQSSANKAVLRLPGLSVTCLCLQRRRGIAAPDSPKLMKLAQYMRAFVKGPECSECASGEAGGRFSVFCSTFGPPPAEVSCNF